MKARHFGLILILCASTARAIPPPPLPPVPPEAQAAARAVAAAMPIEEALSSSNRIRSDGLITYRVTEALLEAVHHPRRGRCDRDDIFDYLRFDVAERLPAALPGVSDRLREMLSETLSRSMSLWDLRAASGILEAPAGRALLLQTWGDELTRSESVARLFMSALYSSRQSLVQLALAKCRRFGRPPPSPM